MNLNCEPYCLSVAWPDHKRPSVENIFGSTIKEARRKLQKIMSDRMYDTLYRNIEEKDDDDYPYDEFIEDFYQDCYMDQDPYILLVFNTTTLTWDKKSDIVLDVYNKTRTKCVKRIKKEIIH
jgi:hypothetical protein